MLDGSVWHWSRHLLTPQLAARAAFPSPAHFLFKINPTSSHKTKSGPRGKCARMSRRVHMCNPSEPAPGVTSNMRCAVCRVQPCLWKEFAPISKWKLLFSGFDLRTCSFHLFFFSFLFSHFFICSCFSCHFSLTLTLTSTHAHTAQRHRTTWLLRTP